MLELDLLMRRRVLLPKIAEIIQKEWGYFGHLSPPWFVQKISAYHKHVFKQKVFKEDPTKTQEIKKVLDLSEKIDVLKELGILVLKQKARADRALELESELKESKGITFKDASSAARKEVKLFSDLLISLADIQMETGILRRAPKQITGEFVEDEKDPTKMNFKVTTEFMETLDLIGKLVDDTGLTLEEPVDA